MRSGGKNKEFPLKLKRDTNEVPCITVVDVRVLVR